jgi:hypothetical protein
VTGNLAAMHAFLRALSEEDGATWEPTRRDVVLSGS